MRITNFTSGKFGQPHILLYTYAPADANSQHYPITSPLVLVYLLKFLISRDLNSSNGTLVNNSQVSSTENTEIFTDDVLQFGVAVGCHLPVRTRIEILTSEDVKYRGRDTTLMTEKKVEDLKKLNSSISSIEQSEQLVSVKLEKLETIIDNIKNIYIRNNEGNEILHKLQIITKSMENLNSLINNKIFDIKDIENSIKNILNDLIKEVVLNNLVQEEKQRELLDYIMKKLSEMPQLTEESMVLNNMSASPADQERSSSPIVFYQDDDIPELICHSDDSECLSSKTKSILKPPRSPKISQNRIRINIVPEVREIENVLDQESDEPEEAVEPILVSIEENVEEIKKVEDMKEVEEVEMKEGEEVELKDVKEVGQKEVGESKVKTEEPRASPVRKKRGWAMVS